MKKLIPVLIITTFTFAYCKDKKNEPGKNADQPKTEEATQSPKQDTAKDSAEIRKVITDFYNWYNKNFAKFQSYELYTSIKKKNNPPYKIDWDEVTKYQDFIRTSVPQLGEEFIKNQKHFFEQCDSAFKVDVQDELPYGFDYDWYTNGQDDPQYLVDEINKARPWPISWAGDYATVAVKGAYDNNGKQEESTFITLTMKKENGQWKIAKIGTE
jgi:hypothetical protein